MSQKKPGLIIFASVYFFVLAAFTLLVILSLIFLSNTEASPLIIFILFFLIGLVCLYLMTGIGLLRKQNWAKLSSLIMFGLNFFGSFSTLSRGINQELSSAYQLGQLFGAVLSLVSSGIGLYAMTYNQSVKNYFNRN